MKIPVHLVEISKHEIKGETIYKYQFIQVSTSSARPWIHNVVDIRSREPLDFELENDYTLDIS